MPKPQKTWREKLVDDKSLPKVSVIESKLLKRWSEGTVAIPASREVDEVMKAVPKGRLITTVEVREKVAKKHNATVTCPMCCGIVADYERCLVSGSSTGRAKVSGQASSKERLAKFAGRGR